MGKFIKISKTGKIFRLTIPKEFHFLFSNINFVYVEEANGVLCIVPVASPTLDAVEKVLERGKNLEVGENVKS